MTSARHVCCTVTAVRRLDKALQWPEQASVRIAECMRHQQEHQTSNSNDCDDTNRKNTPRVYPKHWNTTCRSASPGCPSKNHSRSKRRLARLRHESKLLKTRSALAGKPFWKHDSYCCGSSTFREAETKGTVAGRRSHPAMLRAAEECCLLRLQRLRTIQNNHEHETAVGVDSERQGKVCSVPPTDAAGAGLWEELDYSRD